MRTIRVGTCYHNASHSIDDGVDRKPVVTLGEIYDFYREHHGQPPEKLSCCPPGDCRGTCCGLTGVISNLPPLINAMIERRCDVVPAPMVKKYVGVALAHLTNGDNIDLPADVRGARAIRVLTEFITLVDPPKEPSCDVGCH